MITTASERKFDIHLEEKMRLRTRLTCAGLGALALFLASFAYAEHEADHRYSILGRVTAADGVPISGATVLVTADDGASLGETTTGSDGAYRVNLHVHNDVLGKVFYVRVGDTTLSGEFTFDPDNNRAERTHQMDLGQP